MPGGLKWRCVEAATSPRMSRVSYRTCKLLELAGAQQFSPSETPSGR